jgi:NAD+ kinase
MGINVGRLGFLSSANAEGLDDALKAIARGEYALEARMLLEAVSGGKDVDPTPAVALNDVALEKTTPARVIEVDLAVGDEEVARYTADGFIVATPTGSTAYSLSAGGPVVEPSQRVMVLTPVSAHSPLWRSLVVGTDRAVTLTLAQGTAMLTVDGRPLARLTPPSTVTVTPHPRELQIVRFGGPGFFKRLQVRFHLH